MKTFNVFMTIKFRDKAALLLIAAVFLFGAVMLSLSLGGHQPFQAAALLLVYLMMAGNMLRFSWQQATKPERR